MRATSTLAYYKLAGLQTRKLTMISSLSNTKVKRVRRLQTERRFRRRERQYVIEGMRWIMDAIDRHVPLVELYVTAVFQSQHTALLEQLSITPTLVSDEVMAAMSDVPSPPGVLAIVDIAPLPLPHHPSFLLVLDAITTPGNLGTMLRTAAAAGADGVLLAPGCVDAYNPKVLRGSMGAHFRLPVQTLSWDEIEDVVTKTAVWLATIDGDVKYTAVDWQSPSTLIIGNEANGAGKAARQLATGELTIPMHAATESLNAAMAAGIMLFEAARQRR